MFGKKRQQGPDAKAQMRGVTPEAEAIETQRDYMERMLALWLQDSERFAPLIPDFGERISSYLKRVDDARTLEKLSEISADFSGFAEEANRLIKK